MESFSALDYGLSGIYSDYISSHLQAYQDAGWLADGLANNRYVSGVGTNLLPTIIAGAYECGIRDFDTKLAYEACLKNELDGENRPFGAGKVNTKEFVKYGYVPHADEGEGYHETFMFSASHALEYSYSSWAVAQWARQVGDSAHYNQLMHLSKGWERLYDPSTNFIRPKKEDGQFIDNFNPMQVWRGFQEGNAWQYTFYVPLDNLLFSCYESIKCQVCHPSHSVRFLCYGICGCRRYLYQLCQA